MITKVAWGWRWLAAAVVSLGTAGCVNNYVYGEGGSTSTTSADSGETDASATTHSGSGTSTGGSGGGSSSTGVSSSDSGGTGQSSSGSTMDADAGSTGDPSTTEGGVPLELCQGPCAGDEACGTAADLCVELTRGAEPVCLRSCGRGCPGGFPCTERTSVDGASGLQCAPEGNVCD